MPQFIRNFEGEQENRNAWYQRNPEAGTNDSPNKISAQGLFLNLNMTGEIKYAPHSRPSFCAYSNFRDWQAVLVSGQ